MMTALDIVGSLFLFGIFALNVFNLNGVLLDSTVEANVWVIAQSDRNSISETLDHDFLKVGYRKGGVKIDTIQCSGSAVAWYGDVDRNGTLDTVSYYLRADDSTRLERRFNGSAMTVRTGVTRFTVTYQDSVGNTIPVASLPSQALALNVRGIGVHLEFTNTGQALNGSQTEAYFERYYFPRGLRP